MGAQEFITVGNGRTAREAFAEARDKAFYDYGHSGYSGSIAEKGSFREIPCELDTAKAEALMDECLADMDHWCQDKWGDAACIQLTAHKWVFFGWASS